VNINKTYRVVTQYSLIIGFCSTGYSFQLLIVWICVKIHNSRTQ